MCIAFYAPLKAPTHPVPSGDRRVARLLMQALELAGCKVELASTLRSYEGLGDPERLRQIRDEGVRQAAALIDAWRARPQQERPKLWLTYHLYYKAPDWIGPAVCAEFGIPYVLCEASYAPKRATGPWKSGHEAVAAAIRRADLVLAPTQEDLACVELAAGTQTRISRLLPFLDATPFGRAIANRASARSMLARSLGLDQSVPWLLAVGMMRRGDKLASYLELARALALLTDLPWLLLVAGDGPARGQVQAAIELAAPGRARFLGERAVEDMPDVYACADLCVWPAVNEAYGMALLEAQAAGLAVVACKARGVPEVLRDGETGLLTPVGDTLAFAQAIRMLVADPLRRRLMGEAAALFVQGQRSLEQASSYLVALLEDLSQSHANGSPMENRP